jgi:hypothetical protein
MISETCTQLTNETMPFEISKIVLKSTFPALLCLMLAPFVALLIAGMVSKTLNKPNFWFIFFMVILFELVGLGLYLLFIGH